MVKNDNLIKNLVLTEGMREHNFIHASLSKCVKELIVKKIVKFDRVKKKYIVLV